MSLFLSPEPGARGSKDEISTFLTANAGLEDIAWTRGKRASHFFLYELNFPTKWVKPQERKGNFLSLLG